MSPKTLSRTVQIARLRARDASTLSFAQSYEIYRADLARDLRTADRAFRGEARSASPNAALLWLCDGVILAAGLEAAAFATPLPEVGGHGPILLVAVLIAVGGWTVRRRFGCRPRRAGTASGERR
jgi:hypothetical protein